MKTRSKRKATKRKAKKAKGKTQEVRSRRTEHIATHLRDGSELVESHSPQERLYELLRCVKNLSTYMKGIEAGLAGKTFERNPQEAWACLVKDIAQTMEAVQGQTSNIDCSVLHALNSMVFSVGVRIDIAKADDNPEEVDWVIRQGFSDIQMFRSHLNTLAEKLTQIVKAESSEPANGLKHKLPRRPRGVLNSEITELWKAGERSSAKMAQALNCKDAGTYAPTSRKSIEGTAIWKKKHKMKAH